MSSEIKPCEHETVMFEILQRAVTEPGVELGTTRPAATGILPHAELAR